MFTRPVIGLALLLFFAAQACCGIAAAEEFSAIVSGVTTGDIFQIDRKGKSELVVLYGVQAGPSPVAAKHAREFAIQRVLKQHVTVRIVERRPGMTLVEFTLADGSNLGHVMLRKGIVRWDSFTARDDQGLKDLEALAKQEKLGIWRGAGDERGPQAAPVKAAGGADEKLYDRRVRANYDILEGRSWTDEKGVRTVVLRGNGAKIQGFEGEVEVQAMEENQAWLEEQAWIAEQEAAAQAEADRLAYEEQVRAEQQAQMENIQALNQQLFLGGYARTGIQVMPVTPY